MERYAIVIPADREALLLRCDEGGQMSLEEMQGIVEGPIECAPSALDTTWAREPVDRIVLVVNEEGKLLGLPVNARATKLFAWEGADVLAGNALLMAVRGEELIGFTEPVAKSICAEWGLEGDE